jgi:pimeloyl-ACP methyl ester carboxylesterase
MSKRAPTVILVHGFLDSGAIWRSVITALGPVASGWTTTDLPGMGELCAAKGPFTLARYADEISALIDRAGGPVVLVGHSMGAQIVELAAARRPQNVVGLFLLSPVPLAGVHRCARRDWWKHRGSARSTTATDGTAARPGRT